MTTKTQATEIITAALASNNQPEDAQAFAQRLAIALDALGMLQYADVADPLQPSQDITEDADPPWHSQRQRS